MDALTTGASTRQLAWASLQGTILELAELGSSLMAMVATLMAATMAFEASDADQSAELLGRAIEELGEVRLQLPRVAARLIPLTTISDVSFAQADLTVMVDELVHDRHAPEASAVRQIAQVLAIGGWCLARGQLDVQLGVLEHLCQQLTEQLVAIQKQETGISTQEMSAPKGGFDNPQGLVNRVLTNYIEFQMAVTMLYGIAARTSAA